MSDGTTNPNSDDNGGGGNDGASWLDSLGLPDDVRQHATVAKYAASPEAFARGLIHLEGHLGAPAEQLLRLPKPDDKDGWAGVYGKLGRPENPDGYTARVEGDAMDQDTFAAFRATAHELGLTNAQLEGLTKWYAGTGKALKEKLAELDTAARTERETALRRELGGAYEDTLADAAEAALKFGGDDFAMFLEESGQGNDPRAIKAWAGVAAAMREAGTGFDPSTRGRDQKRGLTPAEAEQELVKMETDPEISKILTDPNHPNQKFYHEKRLALIKAKAAGRG